MPANPAVPIAGNRFCIVGGASLVGSATAGELLDHGAAEVVLFDNFAFGSEAAIAHLTDHPRLKLVRGDVMRMADLLRRDRGHGGRAAAGRLHDAVDGPRPLGRARRQHPRRAERAGGLPRQQGEEGGLRLLQRRLRLRPGRDGRAGGGRRPSTAVGAPPAAILYGASKIIGEQLCRDCPPQARARTTSCCATPRSMANASTTAPPMRSTSSRRWTRCAAASAPQVFGDGSRDQALRLCRRPRAGQPHGLRERRRPTSR